MNEREDVPPAHVFAERQNMRDKKFGGGGDGWRMTDGDWAMELFLGRNQCLSGGADFGE